MNKYLLKNTPETPQMLQSINDLLQSDNDTNVLLAFQLIKTGGCPMPLLSSILAFAMWHESRKIRLKAQTIFKNNASQAFQNDIQTNCGIDFKEYFPQTQESVINWIEKIVKSTHINKNNYVNTTFQLTELALNYCIKHKTKPVKELLKPFLEDDTLDLDARFLTEIPKEIGELTSLKSLYLRYNDIKKIPRELAKLTHLENFLIDENTLYSSELTFLYETFPRVFEQQYVEAILEHIEMQNFQSARKVATKLQKIIPNHCVMDFLEASKFKNKKGSKYNHQALFYYERCLKGEFNHNTWNFNATTWKDIAHDLCNLRASDLALQAVEKGLETIKNLGIYTSSHTLNDEANLYFYEGLAHFWAKDYQKSIFSNEKSLSLNNYAGSWFNKACSYSKMNIKDKMLYNLEECFKLSAWHYVPMASVDDDKDFEDYKKDADFIKLLEKYRIR